MARRSQDSVSLESTLKTISNLMSFLPTEYRIDIQSAEPSKDAFQQMSDTYIRLSLTLDDLEKKNRQFEGQLQTQREGKVRRDSERREERKRAEEAIKRAEEGEGQGKEEGELKEKVMRMREREREARAELERVEVEEQGVAEDKDLERAFAVKREEVGGQLEKLIGRVEKLRNLADDLELRRGQVLENEMEGKARKERVEEEKGELGRKLRQLSGKNKKNHDYYWDVFGRQREVEARLQAVEQEMEEVRRANDGMKVDTAKMEVLEKGLDEQEEVNRMLEEKLNKLTSKMDGMGGTVSVESKLGLRQLTTPSRVGKIEARGSKLSSTSKSAVVIQKNNEVIEELTERFEKLQRIIALEMRDQETSSHDKIDSRLRSEKKASVELIDHNRDRPSHGILLPPQSGLVLKSLI